MVATALTALPRVRAYLDRVPPDAYTEASTSRADYNALYRGHLLHALGGDPEEIRHIVRRLAAGQQADGLLAMTETVVGATHNLLYLRAHKSALFFQLADAYDVDVRPPQLASLVTHDWARDYIDRLDWSNIWLHSNVLLGVATAAHFCRRRGVAESLLDVIIDGLVATASPRGLWGLGRGASTLNAMAGTFHLVPIFECAGAPIPSPDVMATTVLGLQTSSGLFCGPSGYSCVEYDAAYLLAASARARGGVDEETRRAGERLASGISALQNTDGGFPEMGHPPSLARQVGTVIGPAWRHRDPATLVWNLKKLVRVTLTPRAPFANNSVVECAALPHESNVFSTWLRWLTWRLADGLSQRQLTSPGGSCRVVGLNYDGGRR